MKFFIPHSTDEEQEQRVYDAIKKHVGGSEGFSDRKIYSLRYIHDGTEYHAKVGEPSTLNGEEVIAILYQEHYKLFHVCTANRGVSRGNSIMVGLSSVFGSTDFED